MLLSGAIEDQQQLLQAGFSQVRSINEGDLRPIAELMRKENAMENMRKTGLLLEGLAQPGRQLY